MKTTTFSKIAVKNNSSKAVNDNDDDDEDSSRVVVAAARRPEYQLQDYVLPSSKSTNCFVNYKTTAAAATTANWHSDTNLYFKYNKKEQECCVDSIDDNSDAEDEYDEDDGVDDDELLFSDHAGLFKSLTENLEQENGNLNSSSIYQAEDDEDFKKKLNYLLSPNDHYKICRLSNDHLNNYDLDSINNWSMRFSGEFNANNLAALQQQQQRQITTSNRTTSYSSTQSQATTSWNKLKSSKSNQHLQSSSSATTTTTASSSIHMMNATTTTTPPLIKLYQSTRSHQQKYLITSQTTKSLGNSVSGAAAIMTDDEKRARKKMLSKSPTITFGELRQRNSSSSCNAPISRHQQQQLTSTIGTQYPPHLMDQSIQTSMFNEKKSQSYHKVNACLQATEDDIRKSQSSKRGSTSVKFFYKSLPDLAFLNEYDEQKTKKKEKPPTVTQNGGGGGESSNDMKLLLSSSSIDKQRKTLKSIKRYRQTKQNTEPCGPIVATAVVAAAVPPPPRKQVLRSSESFTVKSETVKVTQTTTATQNSTNSSSSSSSSGYVSADKIANMQTTTMATIKSLTRQCDSQQPVATDQQQAKTQQQQLKSCLKRKDSNSNSTSNSYEAATVTPPTAAPIPPKRVSTMRRHNSTATSTGAERNRLNTNFKILFENDELTSSIKDDALNAMPVFVQNIGWLFTCNLKSLQNYSYYKKLNKSASTLAQKCVLTIDTNKINIVQEDEEGEDEDEEEDEQEDDEDDEENEDEVDATSPFIRLRHECGIRNARSDNDLRNKKCVSFSECISQHTITPPTSQASPIHEQHQYLHLISKTSTPLHYATLIEMLKTSKKTSVEHYEEAKKYKIQKHDSIEKLKKMKLVNRMNSNNPYIDADQISLGSLTESPPNEFKFSDDDEPTTTKLDLTNYFTSPQQMKLMNELKTVVFQLNDIFAKELELNNEKQPILNDLLKDNLCLILFKLVKDNLRVDDTAIQQIDDLKYEQLCKLFQYLLTNKFIQQTNRNSPTKSSDSRQADTDEPLFVLNEANSKHKFEAFIYFLLNIKQISTMFEHINNDKNLLIKFYDFTNLNSSSLIYLNEFIFNEFLIQLKQIAKFKFKLKYLHPKQQLQSSPVKQEQQQQQQSEIQPSNVFKKSPSPSPITAKPTGRSLIKKSPSPPKTLPLHYQASSSNNSVGQHLKNISKKFNIKSWFTSSSSTTNSTKLLQTQQSGASLLTSGGSVSNKTDSMKYSFSEPMINEFSVNFNPNSSKL